MIDSLISESDRIAFAKHVVDSHSDLSETQIRHLPVLCISWLVSEGRLAEALELDENDAFYLGVSLSLMINEPITVAGEK